MNKTQFKSIFVQYAKGMIDKWFNNKTFQDILCKSAALTIINANIDKYDNYLEYFCDKNGIIAINDFIDNLISNFIPIEIDLTEYNLPILPNKILLINKNDLIILKNMCIEKITNNQSSASINESLF